MAKSLRHSEEEDELEKCPEDIIVRIYSFWLEEEPRLEEIKLLINSFGLQSKFHYKMCIKFLQVTPIALFLDGDSDYTTTVVKWMSVKRVKLGLLKVRQKETNQQLITEVGIMIKACDVSALSHFYIRFDPLVRELYGNERCSQYSLTDSFGPLEKVFEDVKEEQSILFRLLLSQNMQSLHMLSLVSHTKSFYCPILTTDFARNLRILHLSLIAVRDYDAVDEYQEVSAAIQNMPKLKELVILSSYSLQQSGLSLNSESLRVLKVNSPFIKIEKGYCPRLKEMTLTFGTGVKPPENYLQDFHHAVETLTIQMKPTSRRTFHIGELTAIRDGLKSAVKSMDRLTDLVILADPKNVMSYLEYNLIIESQSLKRLDISGALYAVKGISRCQCPRLKILKGAYWFFPEVTKHHVRPVTPFASNELPLHPSLNDSMKEWIPNYKEPDHASEPGYIQTFQISNRPFVGLDVPASCIVQLYEVRGLEMHLNSARYARPLYRI